MRRICVVLALATGSFVSIAHGGLSRQFGKGVPTASPATSRESQAAKRETQSTAERDHKEMQDAALELSALSRRVSDQINSTGGLIFSVSTLKDLERIEKLAKKLRTELKNK